MTQPPRVLVVEDDESVRRAVTDGLAATGFGVEAAASAEEALDGLAAAAVDLIVLDIGLPGMSGLDLCRRLRADDDGVPILILSARDAVADRVEGLQVGADDYLVKPFDLSELVARLQALHRRAQPAASAAAVLADGAGGGDREILALRGLRIDIGRRTATIGHQPLDLTRREFDLLATLAHNRDLVLSRYTLLEKVWGYDFDVETNVVDVFVGYLRKKLAATGHTDIIRTVRGVGFVIDSSIAADTPSP
ncbi:MAG: response regulator transcription factor [Actinomycetota bacterium]